MLLARLRRFSYWQRILTGALTIVLTTTAATTAFGVDFLERIVRSIETGEKFDDDVIGDLDDVIGGGPQTILLIGSDSAGKGETEVGREEARSDTIILVRLDPDREATAVMSLPRDLRVQIPGHGTDKINAAYSLGGPDLTLKTVRQVTGLQINHLIEVDFGGFTDVIDALGCVYIDVDRRYYNDSLEYTPIDLQAGYQRLCGLQALAYARYRHEDTDIVRGARQQDFLRSFKDQLSFDQLLGEQEKLISIFRENTVSDIQGDEAREVLETAIASATNPIQEIHPEFVLEPEFVTTTAQQMRSAVADFLGVKASDGPRGTLSPADTPTANATGEQKPEPGKAKQEEPRASAEQKQAALEDSSAEGRAQAEAARVAAGFPVCYPTLRTTGSIFAEAEPRVYKIGVGDPGAAERERFAAYRMVIKRGGIGEYYGIQGTTWQDAQRDPSDPPILGDPTEERTVDGRKFEVHYDGDRVRLVPWRTDDGVYWVANTLLQTLSVKEMLKIAASTRCL